jgi:hypothetical protein
MLNRPSCQILLEQARVNRLYVKSTQGFSPFGTLRGSIVAIFAKARALQPCLLVLEDLDSLLKGAILFTHVTDTYLSCP